MALTKYRALVQLMRNERRRAAELLNVQNRKLRRLVRHACNNVPFYRRVFHDAGVRPEDIQSADDLVRLPIIDKARLRSQPVEDLVDQRVDLRELIPRRTSGSSGSPFLFYKDREYDTYCKAQYLRPYLTNGRKVFDKVLHFTAVCDVSPAWFQRMGLMREKRVHCAAETGAMLAALRNEEANIIQGYPSSLSALSQAIEREQPVFRSPRLVFTDSELLTDAMRRQIERAFGVPVFDVFGSWETDNIAWECREHAGYHLAIDCVTAEIVCDGMNVAAGESGELVCTVLDNLAMPFIRYNLKDIAALATGPCSCGRVFPLMSVIEGRTDDQVVLPDGRKQTAIQFLQRFDLLDDIAVEYQIVQEAVDVFRIAVVPQRELSSADHESIAAIVREFHPLAQVTVRETGAIEQEASGKRRVFVCRVGL